MLRNENEEQIGVVLHLRFRGPNPSFYRCKFLHRSNRDLFFAFSGKTRMTIVPSERTWGDPSPPIVENKHVISICKLEKCQNNLFYRCKFLPRLNRDLLFASCGTTRMKIVPSERTWGVPSPPIVENKHVTSLCKLEKCQNHLFYHCKFLPRLNRNCFFAFSGKTRVK